jgi:lipopolysaccharide export system protein LptA
MIHSFASVRLALPITLSAALVVGGGALVAAQSKATPRTRAAASSSRRSRQDGAAQKEDRQLAFGDVMLRRFGNLSGDFSQVRVTGSEVLVDSNDAKTGSTTHMTAREFIVTKAKAGGVGKVEAVGAVKFAGVRPATGRKGMQTFNGSGSKGTYFKQEGRLELDGPVDYYVEQPTISGNGKQWIRGTADHATYDENKKTLVLHGHVRAKVADPEALQEDKPSDIAVDQATLDFSTPKVTFTFTNENEDSGSLRLNPKVEPKKDQKKGGS